MKKFVLVLLVLFLTVSCKKELMKEPERLIDREKMVGIMYDLSLLEAIRYQNPGSVDSMDITPTKFVLRKYKVDSLQFSESNKYYAINYETYKEMFDEINIRIEKAKKAADSLVKIEEKKNPKKKTVTPKDAVNKQIRPIKTDSIKQKVQSR